MSTIALRHLALIVAAIAVLGLITLYAWQSDPEQNADIYSPTRTPSTVFGSGALPDHGVNSRSNLADDSGLVPPSGLAATEDGDLIVNSALLNVIDFFLLEQSDGAHVSALKIYLKSKLPDRAYHEADQIAEHYQAYMKEHDSLLAVQNFPNQNAATTRIDINRIAIWCQQRDRLRQSMLGDKVVQAWYQNDDAQLKQVLGELRQRNDNTNALQEQSPSSPTPSVPRWSNASDEAHHNAYMQDVLAKASRSFSTLYDERRQWSIHYLAFIKAASRVDQEGQADLSERNLQIQELLKQYFHTETERQLAHDRWEAMHRAVN